MDLLNSIIPSTISFILGILTKIIYDRIPFFSKNQKRSALRQYCPEVYVTLPKNNNDIITDVEDSNFFETTLKLKPKEKLTEIDAKLIFSEKDVKDIDFSSKCLITIFSKSTSSTELRYLTYERYGQLSLNNFKGFKIRGENKITFVFNINDRPQELIIVFQETTLIYNLDEFGGNNISPEMKIHKKLKK